MDLDEITEGHHYKFTVLEGGEEISMKGRFLCFAYAWFGTPKDDDPRIVVVKSDEDPYQWRFFDTKDVVNVESE